jgi:hypothetical protein
MLNVLKEKGNDGSNETTKITRSCSQMCQTHDDRHCYMHHQILQPMRKPKGHAFE